MTDKKADSGAVRNAKLSPNRSRMVGTFAVVKPSGKTGARKTVVAESRLFASDRLTAPNAANPADGNESVNAINASGGAANGADRVAADIVD